MGTEIMSGHRCVRSTHGLLGLMRIESTINVIIDAGGRAVA